MNTEEVMLSCWWRQRGSCLVHGQVPASLPGTWRGLQNARQLMVCDLLSPVPGAE